MPTLFPSQEQGVREVFQYFREHKEGHPLLVYPTGSGKTHVIAGICAYMHKKWPNEPVLIVSHVSQILRQDYATLKEYVPENLVGLYSSGLGKREVKQFTVAGIPSIYLRAELFKRFRLVIVDEAHLIPEKGNGMYRTFFSVLDTARIVGMTATPFRLGHGMLTDGIFDKIVYEKKIKELVEEGRLCKVISKETNIRLDTRDVAVLGDDFNKKQLSSKLDVKAITENIVSELLRYRSSRKHWLVFAIDINHAEHITKCLIEQGVVAACLHSKQKIDQHELIDFYKAGGFQAFVSVAKLTTGFDAPNVDLIALLRPTISPVLHIQMIGRGMRVAPGKQDCLVLDFARNLERLGPIDDVHVPKKVAKNVSSGPRTKTCPSCQEIVSLSTRRCACGHTFETQTKLKETASNIPVIGRESVMKELRVVSVSYKKHVSRTGNISLKVTYFCGLSSYEEWVSFSENSYARYQTTLWWKARKVHKHPMNIEEALVKCYDAEVPKTIFVELSGKYPVIKSYTFGETKC